MKFRVKLTCETEVVVEAQDEHRLHEALEGLSLREYERLMETGKTTMSFSLVTEGAKPVAKPAAIVVDSHLYVVAERV